MEKEQIYNNKSVKGFRKELRNKSTILDHRTPQSLRDSSPVAREHLDFDGKRES